MPKKPSTDCLTSGRVVQCSQISDITPDGQAANSTECLAMGCSTPKFVYKGKLETLEMAVTSSLNYFPCVIIKRGMVTNLKRPSKRR